MQTNLTSWMDPKRKSSSKAIYPSKNMACEATHQYGYSGESREGWKWRCTQQKLNGPENTLKLRIKYLHCAGNVLKWAIEQCFRLRLLAL
uniref:Uncharacterized protein n=1 Tax=Arundo donax TaxID=35708 RepID=A0A0A9ER46_ARUDO